MMLRLPPELLDVLQDPVLLMHVCMQEELSNATVAIMNVSDRIRDWGESIYEGGGKQIFYYLREYAFYVNERDTTYHGIISQMNIGFSSVILDAGCGIGQLLSASLSSGASQAIGIDLDPICLAMAGHVLAPYSKQAHFIRGDVTTLPFCDGAFSSIYCRDVLMYTQNSATAFAELVRCLADGGRLFVKIHSVNYYLSRMRKCIPVGNVGGLLFSTIPLVNHFLNRINSRKAIAFSRKGYREHPITKGWLLRHSVQYGLRAVSIDQTNRNTPEFIFEKVNN